ncbi:MAG: hypothetical protein PHG06_19065 [Parabacteroides sp.]|nr:hypothetical protein [Parabacteroides sp.]
MVEYGYINESGYLVSEFLKDYTSKYKDENGDTKERIITINEQIEAYSVNGFKPVDPIDEIKLSKCEENYTIHLRPYDAGDHIAYEYHKLFDVQKFKNEINDLKQKLSDNDYKVTKCMEANLVGLPLPYDIQSVHSENQSYRDRINEIEEFINLNIKQ